MIKNLFEGIKEYIFAPLLEVAVKETVIYIREKDTSSLTYGKDLLLIGSECILIDRCFQFTENIYHN